MMIPSPNRSGLRAAFFYVACLLTALSCTEKAAGSLGLNIVYFTPSFRSWTIDPGDGERESTVSQWNTPIKAIVPMNDFIDFILTTTAASAQSDLEVDESSTLGGLSDVKAQVFLRLYDDRLLVHAGANLPSGKTALTADELGVAQTLGHPLLGFQLREYGKGLGASAGLALAQDLGSRLLLGFGAGVLYQGPYTLIAGEEDYTPGLEGSASAGLDIVKVGWRAARLRFDTTYRLFGQDKMGSEAIFEEGNQLELQASGIATPPDWIANLLARVVFKADNTEFDTGSRPVRELDRSAGTFATIVASISRRCVGALHVGVAAAWTQFTGSDTPGVDGYTYAIGPEAILPVNDRTRVDLLVQMLAGTIDEDEVSPGADLGGIHVGLGLTWQAGE